MTLKKDVFQKTFLFTFKVLFMKLLKVFLVFALLVNTGCYLVKKQTDYYGVSTGQYKNIVFILDTSGSMEGINEPSVAGHIIASSLTRGGQRAVTNALGNGTVARFAGKQLRKESTKLGAARRELIPAIKGLTASSQFSLITFETNVRRWKSLPVPASDENKTKVVLHLNTFVKANGATSAKAALIEAFKIADIDAIFFLSDGQPTDANAATILNEVTRLNSGKHVHIHTIGLGSDKDAAFLQNLATQNGGTYYESKWF